MREGEPHHLPLRRALDRLAAQAMAEALPQASQTSAGLRPTPNPRHGDYQLNTALALSKRVGRPPRDIAEGLAAALRELPAIGSATVAGPGFVNLRVAPGWLGRRLANALRDTERDGVPAALHPERVVVDYSSPNVAKEMHVGHLRSTILGDALANLCGLVGHCVHRDNHLGDWGTQFGLLLAGLEDSSLAELGEKSVDDLEEIYRRASQRSKQDAAFLQAARAHLARLHAGDPETRQRWEQLMAVSRRGLVANYERLGVEFDSWRGESAYHDALPALVKELESRGLARRDAGALCVFFSEHAAAPEVLRRTEAPFIVQKADGAFLYATTDIATAIYRREALRAERVIYVVDTRQSLHFQQLFALLELMGVSLRADHVGFGSILGEDGRPLRTRDGDTIRLSALLDQAERGAAERMDAQELDIAPADRRRTARIIGVGAVKYADLKQNRLSDYRFGWDKMLSFQGNSSPYLQYSYARVQALFRKAEGVPGQCALTDAAALAESLEGGCFDAAELPLAKRLGAFGDAIHDAVDSLEPHAVCDHLYALAREFSAFYEHCPVLKSEGATRTRRLALSALVGRQLRRGLAALGIGVVERM